MISTKSQILKIISQKGECRPHALSQRLGISSQATHRHLRDLCAAGQLIRNGSAPVTVYRMGRGSIVPRSIEKAAQSCAEIIGSHPAVLLITLFGSHARGRAKPTSDVDVLVWLNNATPFNRQDLWQFWDRHGRLHPWKNQLSIIVRKWNKSVPLETLLLDFPEEHIPIFDRCRYYWNLRDTIVKWRVQWGAQKLPSFGETHGWRYSTKVKRLSDIDFRLELTDVT